MAATIEDVTLSVYALVNSFAASKELDFLATTSIESAASLMHEATDKLILVQNKLSAKTFLAVEYKIFLSPAATTDINSLLETEIMSDLLELFKLYSKVCVYEASGLKQVPSVFSETGVRMVVSKVGQNIVSITQMKHNLNAVEVTLLGRIE